MTTLPFTKIDYRAITPTRNNPTDAGIDIFALEDVVLQPGEVQAFRTGIKVALNPDETILLWDKSGRAYDMKWAKAVGLTVLAGCVDEPYRGEIVVVMANVNLAGSLLAIRKTLQLIVEWGAHDHDAYESLANLFDQNEMDTVVIPYGKALTQMVIAPLKYNVPVEIQEEEFDELPATLRGADGFGSSDEVSPRGSNA